MSRIATFILGQYS